MKIKCSNCGKEIKDIGVMSPTLDSRFRNLCKSCANKHYNGNMYPVEGVLPKKHSTGKTGDWEVKFDSKFFYLREYVINSNVQEWDESLAREKDQDTRNEFVRIKQFISNLLQEQKQEIIQMGEEVKKYSASNYPFDYSYNEYVDGYNQAISDYQERIKNGK